MQEAGIGCTQKTAPPPAAPLYYTCLPMNSSTKSILLIYLRLEANYVQCYHVLASHIYEIRALGTSLSLVKSECVAHLNISREIE